MEELNRIIKELKAPKNQKNNFGGYMYRSAEDILEAVKPLLGTANVSISDEIINVGSRYYIKATVTFMHGDYVKIVTAFAREPESKKGMDESQITGMASSYARKYALNGLFLIDDTKDADTMDNRPKDVLKEALELVKTAKTQTDLKFIWESYPELKANSEFKNAITKKKADVKE